MANANCLIVSAHICCGDPSVAASSPASSLLPFLRSHLRLSHSPAHCIAAAPCEQMKSTTHDSYTASKRVASHSPASLYRWKGGRATAERVVFTLSPPGQEDPSNYRQTHDHSKQHPSPRAIAITIRSFCRQNGFRSAPKATSKRTQKQH